jgi:hypothetical protein
MVWDPQVVSFKMRTAVAGMILLLGLCANAGAQAIADNMTCAQAVSHYERNGRIYKIAHGKDVIPIYLGVPVSRRNALYCDYGQIKAPYSLKTTDNRRCVIAYQCVAGGWDR